MAEYNLSEFRANMRKAFNEAEAGEPVMIDRHGVEFYLIEKDNWNGTLESQTKIGDEKNIIDSQANEGNGQ